MRRTICRTCILILTLIFGVGSAALATSVAPVLIDPWTSGNAEDSCAPTTCSAAYAYKIDNWAGDGMDGTYATSGNTITIANSDGKTFDWASEYPVCAVVVKAGTGAYIYYYSGAYGDTGLVAPWGKDISHVAFCFDEPPAVLCATICGIKFHDRNANGVRDMGDPSANPAIAYEELLRGWRIDLYKWDEQTQTWAPVTFGETDNSGAYSFTVYEAGLYRVKEVQQAGWKQTAPATFCHEFEVVLGDPCTEYPGNDFGNIKLGCIGGYKFKDCNGNAELDADEGGIAGWKIYLAGTDLLGNDVTMATVTNAEGRFTFTDLLPGTYGVCEELRAGWLATTDDCFFVDPLGVGEQYVGPKFGNTPLGTITACKFYDLNFNGVEDGEDPVMGITFVLTKADGTFLAEGTTGACGCVHFTDLLPGCYTLTEVLTSNWIPTTDTKIEGIVVACEEGASEQREFGNVKIGCDGGGHTHGFWSNKNGQKAFEGIDDAVGILQLLSLRNDDGSPFEPTSYDEFRTWLKDARATNMAYMLSAQLAAMALNVAAGFVDSHALVYAPDVEGANAFGFVAISEVITQSVAALAANGYTPAGDINRSYQEILKDALDAANNNENFLCLAP